MPKYNPLISVVMPVYNSDWCMTDAIRSVIGQTYDNWELIVVDDGSTDTTQEVMRFWINHDKRIKYLRRDENKGIAYSRNEGNEFAKGELIAVMDSDDVMLVERLMAAVKTYKKKKYDVLYTGYYKTVIGAGSYPQELFHVQENFTDDLLDPIQQLPHLTMVATKVMYTKVPYQSDKRVNDDWFWCVDLYNAGARFVGLDFPTMLYRVNINGVSHKSREQYDEDYKNYKINRELRKQNVKT